MENEMGRMQATLEVLTKRKSRTRRYVRTEETLEVGKIANLVADYKSISVDVYLFEYSGVKANFPIYIQPKRLSQLLDFWIAKYSRQFGIQLPSLLLTLYSSDIFLCLAKSILI
jgi:hypothetical protein